MNAWLSSDEWYWPRLNKNSEEGLKPPSGNCISFKALSSLLCLPFLFRGMKCRDCIPVFVHFGLVIVERMFILV